MIYAKLVYRNMRQFELCKTFLKFLLDFALHFTWVKPIKHWMQCKFVDC